MASLLYFLPACAMFLFSALCISLMRVPEPLRAPSTECAHVWREMREGVRVLWSNSILRATAGYICTHHFFGGAYAALYLIYALKLFSENILAFSVLVALGGIGALAGSFCSGYCARRFGYGKTLVGSALFLGTLSFCTPLAVGPLSLVFALMALGQFVGDAGFAVYSIHEISLRQELVPVHLHFRISSSQREQVCEGQKRAQKPFPLFGSSFPMIGVCGCASASFR